MFSNTVRSIPQTVTHSIGPALSDAEFDLVQSFIVALFPAYESRGFSFHVSTDFNEFVAIRRASANGFVYPTYDPGQSRITAENGFWVKICNAAGDVIAGQATRLFDTSDFYTLLRSGRVWFDRPLTPVPDFPFACTLPNCSGRVAHLGGLWVDAPYRGHKLASLICATTRALTLRNFGFDHETGLCFEPIALKRLPIDSYGHPQLALCIDGHFPLTGKKERVYMSHVSRAQALRQIENSWGLAEPATAPAPQVRIGNAA
jgi:hypothetical protein